MLQFADPLCSRVLKLAFELETAILLMTNLNFSVVIGAPWVLQVLLWAAASESRGALAETCSFSRVLLSLWKQRQLLLPSLAINLSWLWQSATTIQIWAWVGCICSDAKGINSGTCKCSCLVCMMKFQHPADRIACRPEVLGGQLPFVYHRHPMMLHYSCSFKMQWY